MPIESPKSPLELSKSDIWEAVFERKDREFPDDKGKPAELIIDRKIFN